MADMASLLAALRQDWPGLQFAAGNRFCWSPARSQVVYRAGSDGPTALYSLLHETAHALLDHQRYQLDFELLGLEIAAWERARELAAAYGIRLDEDHVQDCLDTYRDWLYRRSICPRCDTKTLQLDNQRCPEYRCYNCQSSWRVANSRFCRPYRQTASRYPDGSNQLVATFAENAQSV